MNEPRYAVGDGLLGRAIDASGALLDGPEGQSDLRTMPLAEASLAAPQRSAPWETGIKVVDLYAPIALGASVALIARPGVGMVVLVCELIYRLAQQRGGAAVFAKLESEGATLKDSAGPLRESGIERSTALIVGRYDSPPEERREVVRAALAAAEDFAARGRDTILVIDDGLAIAETAALLIGRARALERGSLTILLCFWRHDGALPAEAASIAAAADARLVLSKELARQSIWPAVDTLASDSRLPAAGAAPAEQRRIANAARDLLSRGVGAASAEERMRAHKLLLFQSQPFFVAEPFTARPAEYVPLAESTRTFAAIVAGAHDQTPADALQFVGAVRR